MINELSQLIGDSLKGFGIKDLVPSAVPTDDPSHGDYATSVAFQASKKLGKDPMETAEIIRNALSAKRYALIEKIEVAKPGFINFTLSSKALLDNLSTEHKKGASGSLMGSKIMVEFTDPNPFKEFHIGHLYSNIVGESISRLLEANGAQVRRVCYQGDVGLHVAKSLYGLKRKIEDEGMVLGDLKQKELTERVRFLGEAYAHGATQYEESEAAKQEIIIINKKVYEKDQGVMDLYELGKSWSLEYFETIYQRLGTTFTKLYFESDAGPIGLDLVKQYLATVFEESDGAVIFPGEKYGLHTRVFINSLGLPTYEAKELGLAVTKHKDYPFDQSIMITGNEINEYFKVLIKALSIIRPDIASRMKHISHGMVRLPEGKMSSRSGKIVTGEWLLDEAVTRAGILAKRPLGGGSSGSRDEMQSGKGEEEIDAMHLPLTAKQDLEEVSEIVGVGAVKWALLKTGLGKDIEFSFDESVSFEGNSGPYLQYTYVRTQSVLSKWRMVNGEWNPKDYLLLTINYALSGEERLLLVLLCQYSDIVANAAEKFSPSTVATYLFELAQAFNNFYQKHQILKEEGEVRSLRLQISSRVGTVLRDGLYLLGISVPERM